MKNSAGQLSFEVCCYVKQTSKNKQYPLLNQRNAFHFHVLIKLWPPKEEEWKMHNENLSVLLLIILKEKSLNKSLCLYLYFYQAV